MHGRRGDTPHRERRAPGPVRWRTGTHNVRGVCCGRAGPTSRPGARRFTRQPLAPLSRRTHTITNKRPASSQPAWRHMPPRPQQQQDLSPARPDQQAPLLGARTRPSSDTTRLLRAPSFAAVPCPTYRACHTHAPTRVPPGHTPWPSALYRAARRMPLEASCAPADGQIFRSELCDAAGCAHAHATPPTSRSSPLCTRTSRSSRSLPSAPLCACSGLVLRPLGACRAPQRPP